MKTAAAIALFVLVCGLFVSRLLTWREKPDDESRDDHHRHFGLSRSKTLEDIAREVGP